MPDPHPTPHPFGQPHLDPDSAGRLLRLLDDGGAPSVPGQAAPAATHCVQSGGHDAPSIPGYTITAKIASGGGGTVYRAVRQDGGSERPLALKLLSIRLGSGPAAQRAWRELEVLESLRLPCVPRLIDYGQHDGRLYLVTEFIEGLPPDRYCEQHNLDRRARVALLARIADAVQSLHERAVIHRDLKPSNILVTEPGEPVILDLGLALVTGDLTETLTAHGQPVGTPAFMAPEQARGERNAISTRTDIYALGAIGYVLLTWHTPHDLANISLHAAVQRIAGEPARPARELEPTLPKALGAVLGKACAAEPRHRYASAGELAQDLQRWLAGEQVEAEPPTLWVRATAWMRKHPLLTTAAGCVLVAVLTLGSVSLIVQWLHHRPYRLRVSPDGQSLWLLSRDGNIMRRWDSDSSGEVSYVQVKRPMELGGGEVALVLMEFRLCLFRFGEFDAPEWCAKVTPPETRNPLLSHPYSPEGFVVRQFIVRDVFPQSPGEEVICLCNDSKWSASVLRVYDLAGNVLYEAWHNGWLRSADWCADEGMLIVTGVNSDAKWFERGQLGVDEPYPLVVFALRPEFGKTGGWITTPARQADVDPLWYKCLLPPSGMNGFSRSHLDAGIDSDPDHKGRVRIIFGSTGGSARTGWMVLHVGFDGEVVDRFVFDTLRQRFGASAGSMIDPELLTLGDLPPIVEPRTHAP